MFWKAIHYLEGCTIYPDTFKRVIPYLFGSLVYHHDWLTSNLDASTLVTYTTKVGDVTIVENFKSRVLRGTYDCSDAKIQAAGIPGDKIIAH